MKSIDRVTTVGRSWRAYPSITTAGRLGFDYGHGGFVLADDAHARLRQTIFAYLDRTRPGWSFREAQLGCRLGWFPVRPEDVESLTSALAAYLFNPANLRRDPDLLGCPYPREAEWAKAELNRQRIWEAVKGCLSDEVAGDPLAVIDGLARGEA